MLWYKKIKKKGHVYWQPFGSWLPLTLRGGKKQNTRRTTALAAGSCRERPNFTACLPRSQERSEQQVHLHSRIEWSCTITGPSSTPSSLSPEWGGRRSFHSSWFSSFRKHTDSSPVVQWLRSACQCRCHGFDPWSGRISLAVEPLSPWTTTTEPLTTTEPKWQPWGPRATATESHAPRARTLQPRGAAATRSPCN